MSKIQSANSVSPLDAVNPLEEMSPGAAIGAEATYGSNAGALDVLETSGVGSLDVLPFSLPEGTGTADQAERSIAGEWTEMLADGRVRKHDTDSVKRVSPEDGAKQWTEMLADGRVRKHDTDSVKRVSPEDGAKQWTEMLPDGRVRKHDTDSVKRVSPEDGTKQWTEMLPDGRVRKHDTETVRRMRAESTGVSEGGGVTADVDSSGDSASLLAAKIADVAGATEVGSALTEKLQTLQDGMREHFPARFEAAKAAAKEAREREVPGTKVDGK